MLLVLNNNNNIYFVYESLGKGTNKNLNVSFYQKGGGGATPKFIFLQSELAVKKGFKLGFFKTRMCYFKCLRRSFMITTIFFLKFFSTSVHWRRGWSTPIWKKFIFRIFIFWHPSLMVTKMLWLGHFVYTFIGPEEGCGLQLNCASLVFEVNQNCIRYV